MVFEDGNVGDGAAVAQHLLAALLYSSGKWYDPTVELTFRTKSAWKSYEVVNRDGLLRVRPSSLLIPDALRKPLALARSPREALQAMRADAGGDLVKVGVECRDGGNSACSDAVFWDIKFSHRKAAGAGAGEIAVNAARALRP